MIDMHCHIVPYTDDGSKNMNMTLEMAREAVKAGYNKIFATSHYIIHDSETVYDEYRKNINNLNEKLKDEGIDLKLYYGNEVFFTNNITELLKENKICSYNDSRYVLVEFPLFNDIIPMNAYDEFNKLQDEGYIPILAHPERYDFTTKNIDLLIPLIESGVLLQCNIGSILGKYGNNAKKNIKKLLKRNMVHFFGTDSHNTHIYLKEGKALKKIKKIVKNDEIINKILYENPEKVLNNEKIQIWYPKY